MKKLTVILLFSIFVSMLISAPVTQDTALQTAEGFIDKFDYPIGALHFQKILTQDTMPLAYLYTLYPAGYLVITADDCLPPVIAYAFENSYQDNSPEGIMFEQLICADIQNRLTNRRLHPEYDISADTSSWLSLLQRTDMDRPTQWPPEGYSPTGGWLKTNWTQSAPYNQFCPMDPVTNNRSLAGCPSVAMGQIVNYHTTINGTVLSDTDDYYHNYAGRSYQIDDDYATIGFADFTQTNNLLTTAMQHYRYQMEITDADKAAVVWACGIAAQQVYTSSGSGTFSVNQAYQAFQRFDFQLAPLITENTPQLWQNLATEMMNAYPAHLAVVTPAWDAGHNLVVDGYNTDGFFHLNFGWGGSNNGWYLLPDQIPYNLSVLEGIILGIRPKDYLFVLPDTLNVLTIDDCMTPHSIEVMNISQENVTIEDWVFPQIFGQALWVVDTAPITLPVILSPGQSMFFHIMADLPIIQQREILEHEFRIIHNKGVVMMMIRFNTALITGNDDNAAYPLPMTMNVFPNPAKDLVKIGLKSPSSGVIRMEIYNLKGQTVYSLDEISLNSGETSLVWKPDGLASGIYFVRLICGNQQNIRKLLIIR